MAITGQTLHLLGRWSQQDFFGRLDLTIRRRELKMAPKLYLLSNWKDEVVTHTDDKDCQRSRVGENIRTSFWIYMFKMLIGHLSGNSE